MSSASRQRRPLTREAWSQMASEPSPPLSALWADTREVYALLRGVEGPFLVSTEVEDGGYPALSPVRPRAAWFERMVLDLWGHAANGGSDPRPWLDHGRWAHSAPLALRPGPPRLIERPEFALDEALDQLPLGPVRGDLGPAAHLRLGISGETIVRMEARLGYTHKGTLALMRGKSPRAAARFAARLAGEATVAHAIAFARATEAASDCEVPPRAISLRAVMAEVERVGGNLGVLAAIAETVRCDALATRLDWHAEMLRRAALVAFGHRLMMDCVIPGGVAADIPADGDEALGRALSDIAFEAPELHSAVGGLPEVDVATRPRDRLRSVALGAGRVRELLATAPDGVIAAPLAPASGEAIGFADGPGGEVWHWLKLDHGQIAGAFLCDPSWEKWALLQEEAAGADMDDLALVMASLGLSSSGVDL
jgi:Ni,Fe-hydrogenase III large subunit